MNLKNQIVIACLMASTLTLTACSVDQVTLTLGSAVDALAAVAAVAAPQDLPFINLASSCLNGATTELDSTDTNLQKVTVIVGTCAKVEAGASGLSPLGMALANAVSTFLIEIKSLEAIRFSRPEFANAFAASTVSHIDKKKLEKIKKKLSRIPKV